MKKFLVLMLVLSLALLFVGCSDDDKDDDGAKISVKNLTQAEITVTINDVELEIDPNETSTFIFDDEMFVIQNDVSIPYTVQGIFIATEARTATINKGKTTKVEIISEGGVIAIKNDFDVAIEQIRIYMGEDYGNAINVLTEPLVKGETKYILKDENTYNVLIKPVGYPAEIYGQAIVVDNQKVDVSYYKRLFVIENKTAKDIRYKLNDESYTTILPDDKVVRTLGVEFDSNVILKYSGLYVIEGEATLDYSTTSIHEYIIEPQLGALYVQNNTTANITEVYLTQSATNWGPDYMAGTIAPNQNYGWAILPGLWNVKIVDNEEYQAVLNNIQVNVNETRIIDYGDDKQIRINFDGSNIILTPVSNDIVKTNK